MFTSRLKSSGTSTDVCIRSGLEDEPLRVDNSDTESVLSVGCSTISDEGVGDDIGISVADFLGLEPGVFKNVRSSSSLDATEFADSEERFGIERTYGSCFGDPEADAKIVVSGAFRLKCVKYVIALRSAGLCNG